MVNWCFFGIHVWSNWYWKYPDGVHLIQERRCLECGLVKARLAI